MNQYHQPQSPTYQHHQLFTKNNRLYQQLVQDDYLNDHIYQSGSQKVPHAAHIKFNHTPSYPIKITKEPQYAHQREDFSPRLPRNNNIFKGSEPSVGRMSNHATQSLSSNYCITENENEENSTVNLYSLSRNHIQPDLQLSSNNITAKINDEDQQCDEGQKTIKNDNIILNDSILNNNSIRKDEACEAESQKIKRYRSQQQYCNLPYHTDQSNSQEEEGKMPKLLVQKYFKNQTTKKFSLSQKSEHDENSFKTVLNEIHVVPYKINNQVRPYAFSVPVQNKQYSTQNITIATSQGPNDHRRAGKANSLNLNVSNQSVLENEDEIIAKNPTRPLYFSNHTHLNLPNQNRSVAHFIPQQQPQSVAAKARAHPRSQPKYGNSNNDRNRSNSIECKNKPNINGVVHQNEYNNAETQKIGLQQSHVTVLFKNNSNPQEHLAQQQNSVIYESTGIDVCCGLIRQSQQANKINFKTRPKEQKEQAKNRGEHIQSPFFCSSIDMSKVSSLQNQKGNYKINPIQMIRQMNQPQVQKGIKLVGFPNRKDKL